MNERIKISIGRTINLGNFNSAKIEIGYERDLNPKEDIQKAINAEYEFVTELVENKELEIREEYDAK